ncbi:MAG: FMN-binding negative transcriptional regulator [Pseudomonadota bacterium]
MHPNPSFRKETHAQNLAFARARSFGVLTLGGADGPLAAHIPFVLNEAGDAFEGHLVRSNPILRVLDAPQPALMIVSGSDGYVSPDWYEIEDQVPTWNYVAVHLRGQLRRLPQEALEPHSRALSAQFEGRLRPKTPWTQDKMQPETLAKMQRMIVPIRFDIEEVSGTWKLNQNKSDTARLAAARQMPQSEGQELDRLAELMTHPPSSNQR